MVPTPSQALFFPQSQYVVLKDHFKSAYSFQWTLSVQREFGHGWQAQVDYVGNTTRCQPLGVTLNPAVFIPGVWGANGTGCAGIVTTGPAAVKPGAPGTSCSTTSNQNSRFLLTIENPTSTNATGNQTGGNQYAGGGGGLVVIDDEGSANYNALISSIQHRLSSTFSLMANWTWAKCLNVYDAQGDYGGEATESPYNFGMDYGPCGSDYRHTENVVFVAQSHFTRFGRTTRFLINDWELAPLVHIMSGAPFTVTAGQDNSLTDIGADRPNLLAGVTPYHKVKIRKAAGEANRTYLNPDAFAQVTSSCGPNLNGCAYLGTYGNISRNSFRGPNNFQLDAQISRTFPIRDSLKVLLRLEAFNVPNHPNFSTPSSSTLTSSTFGQISSTSNAARIFQGVAKITF